MSNQTWQRTRAPSPATSSSWARSSSSPDRDRGAVRPIVAPHDPSTQDLTLRLRPPFWLDGAVPGMPLGTDELGRDVLSRLIYGARVSLLVGVAATILSGVIGTTAGLIAGQRGGRVGSVIMRLADVQLGIPSLLLALAVIAAFGSGFWRVIIILGVTGWVGYARIVRSEVLSLREREFVLAANAIGVTQTRIAVRHLLPNVMASIATIATLQVAAVIIAEASLSYLGLGVPPTIPTWGACSARVRASSAAPGGSPSSRASRSC